VWARKLSTISHSLAGWCFPTRTRVRLLLGARTASAHTLKSYESKSCALHRPLKNSFKSRPAAPTVVRGSARRQRSYAAPPATSVKQVAYRAAANSESALLPPPVPAASLTARAGSAGGTLCVLKERAPRHFANYCSLIAQITFNGALGFYYPLT
jgi:hypothetical protein